MNYIIDRVKFKLLNFNNNSKNIINCCIDLYLANGDITKYKIINYLGYGTVGQVYLLKKLSDQTNYVIKISNEKCQKNLIYEVKIIKSFFTKNKIVHNYYPIYWGIFKNLNAVGVIYPYLGFYNLEKIKSIGYSIDFTNNVLIVKQLIKQLNNINSHNIIHCDLKSANIVFTLDNNYPSVNIIDFGLAHLVSDSVSIISTNYITSPESLLTIAEYSNCVSQSDSSNIDFSKHDYFGLLCIVLDLFTNCGVWSILTHYMTTQLNIKYNKLLEQNASSLFVYIWYRFSCRNLDDIPLQSLKNLINKIESQYSYLATNEYYLFDDFFIKYIKPNLIASFDSQYVEYFMDFLKNISYFDSTKRPELANLLKCKFLK